MQLRVGNYQLPANCARIGVDLSNEHDDLGIIAKQTIRWDIAGELLASGQAAVVAACIQLENAMRQIRPNIVFLQDSGAPAMSLTNAASIGGVRITNFRYTGDTGGFEFVNGRTFTFTAEAKYSRITGAGGVQLLTFTETVETDGTDTIAHNRPVNAPPQPVQIYSHSLYTAVQSGQATCLLGYWPAPRATLGPTIKPPRVAKTCDGKIFTTTWTYQYERSSPFGAGLPTVIR